MVYIKKSLLLFTLFIIVFFAFSNASATTSKNPQLGGRIVTTQTPPVTCTSQYGPIVVAPASGSSAVGPFVILGTNKAVIPGGQILGQYDPKIDMKTCFIQAGPYRIPIPSYKIKTAKFNTSKY